MKNNQIADVHLRKVLNSNGDYCPEVQVALTDGTYVYESCPKGTTTGKYDAFELSYQKASEIFPRLREAMIDLNVMDQALADKQIIDAIGHEGGRVRGANLSAAASMAICRAGACTTGQTVKDYISSSYGLTAKPPNLIVNILNGGAHAGNGLPVTECMIVIRGVNGDEMVSDAVSVYKRLRDILVHRYGPSSVHVGLEGGFAPSIQEIEEAIEVIKLAIAQCTPQSQVSLGLDIAASSLYDEEQGQFRVGSSTMTAEEFMEYWVRLVVRHPQITYLEDPMNEDHPSYWAKLRNCLPQTLICGDDLTSTYPKRLRTSISQKLISAVVLKINQCGSLTELIECFRIARQACLPVVISQRSCETDSDFLAHLAVGLGADYLKAGACARERIIKYNAILRIGKVS